MSWDRTTYNEYSSCKCGKGKVVRHMYYEQDDWNRFRDGCTGEEILCTDCSKHYRIYHLKNYHHDGIIEKDKMLLISKDMEFPVQITEKSFYFSELDKEIVANIALTDIKAAINDMKTNKFNTKLTLYSSQRIVQIYYSNYKKTRLNLVIPVLEKIVQNYESYEWTTEKIEEYRIEEKKRIEINKQEIKEAIAHSYELVFERG